MSIQLVLRLDQVPVSCEVQERYHAIAPCLAGKLSVAEQAHALNLSYSTVARWLRQFRTEGRPGLFPASEYPRAPYTPERAVVMLLYFKCCAPRASDRELARVISAATNEWLHHETVKALLNRYFFWRYSEFRDLILYPVPADLQTRRLEMVKLRAQGWSEQTVAVLMRSTRVTVRKWVRRFQHEQEAGLHEQARLLDHSHAPHTVRRKIYFGTIQAVLTLQKKYGYAGWFRIQGYLERDFGIRLGQTTLKKVMRLNRRVHLAPQRPVELAIRAPREGPPISKHPFEHAYIDIRVVVKR